MRVLRIQTQQFIVSSLLGMIECKWSASPKRFGGSTTPINAQQMQLSPAFRQSTAYKEGCIAHENACSNKLQVSYNHTRGTFVPSLLLKKWKRCIHPFYGCFADMKPTIQFIINPWLLLCSPLFFGSLCICRWSFAAATRGRWGLRAQNDTLKPWHVGNDIHWKQWLPFGKTT